MKQCPICDQPTVGFKEVGWKKLRIVGESPTGYQYKVLTIRVVTGVMVCAHCAWEVHGYIHEGEFVIEDEEATVA